MEKFCKVVRRIGQTIYVIAWVIFAFILVATVYNKLYTHQTGAPPKVFGITPSIVVSESMVPTLEVYGMNFIKSCDTDDVEVGDIIVYRNYERRINIVHRVVQKYEDDNGVTVLKTKGDANDFVDATDITDNNLIGKVVFIANWMSGILKHVILPNGYGINYTKLFGYTILWVVGIWLIGAVISNIFKHLLKKYVIKEKIEANTSTDDSESKREQIRQLLIVLNNIKENKDTEDI